ncbi:Cell morphoproteinsis protein PAG1 [Pleurotus pulmonarius]|nr:Cell morphoproteinsis protein PAG1 [Pleurotus pulmonarius]
MVSDGMQITIPDFDDNEYGSAPIPFGRSANPFGGGGGGGLGLSASSFSASAFGSTGSGQDSPTITTPLADRWDKSHGRGDSVASVDSANSFTTRFGTKPHNPFSNHASQPSTSSSPFTKKPSFASIRNAFKSSAKTSTSDVPPPVPQFDLQAYPVLKNPFNRSNSSLNQRQTAMSPSYARPSTPGSADFKFGRSRNKSHTPGKSHHSQSGSIFHVSDAGSDYGTTPQFSSSPPPVPRVPNAFGFASRSETPEMDDDKVVMDPKTPSDYALHAVFMRFASVAESKISTFLRNTAEDPSLPAILAVGTDPKFDDTLQSLAKIAQRNCKPVVDSIMRWRKSQQQDPVGTDIISIHARSRNQSYDISTLLTERKALASIYVMCRALIAVLQAASKEALGDTLGYSLEDTTFEQFRRPDFKLLAQSANHRANAELYATLIGLLANIRFVSVTDRFLSELGPVASGQVPKDSDMRYENLLQGLRHITIKVWPPETFEEGAEFLESLSKSFANAHGLRLKIAFAETLLHLIHPIGKTAQAETNNPQWAKAIEIIYPKAKEMVSKPRYWHAAYPLLVTSLCVAPQAFFLKNWLPCFESGLSKLKERPYRVPILNGLIRLLWTYLYRCPETASTTTAKLETLLKSFFPPNRLSVYPQEDQLQPFVYIVHFILSRHFEYGSDVCMELMQESTVKAIQHSGNISSVLAPERTSIAVQAILLTLHRMESDEHFPSWPTSADFSAIPTKTDYPSSSDFIPPAIMSRPGVQELFDRCGTVLAILTVHCGKNVGYMSIFDDQWSYARLNPAYEESNNYVVRKHPEGAFAYPASCVPQITMLQTCFQSWPRCLPTTIPLTDAIDILLRGVVHVEPSLGDVARDAVKRFMAEPAHAMVVLSRFALLMFSPTGFLQENNGPRLPIEASQLLQLWIELVDGWVKTLTMQPRSSLNNDETQRCSEVEAGGLFLLAHENPAIHSAGVTVLRILGLLVVHIDGRPFGPNEFPATTMRFVEILHGRGAGKSYLSGYDELLEGQDLDRLEQWRHLKRIDVPLRMADSAKDIDKKLWRYAFPMLLQSSTDQSSQVLATFRESLIAAVSRCLPLISHIAGLSSRAPPGITTRNQSIERDGQKLVMDNKQLIDQWYIWVKILCSTAISESSRPALTQLGREHSRAPSDISFERERLSTTRGLFRYLTPFLDSEYTQFRDAAVLCISSFPSSGYSQLLEDLSLLASRQFYDDSRAKTPNLGMDQSHGLASRQLLEDLRPKAGMAIVVDRTRRQERLHSAVARIYYLTAHYLQHTRSTGRQAALANVLKFVRNTQAFLTSPETRDNPALQRLRRYFCGTVERLFDGMASLKDSDRFIPSKMHLTLYHLCEGWCQLGPQSEIAKQRLILMQRAAASVTQDSKEAVKRFQAETAILSYAAAGALASLVAKAYFPPEQASNSPTERPSPEDLKPLTTQGVMDKISAILACDHAPSVARGKKALKLLLSSKSRDHAFTAEALKRAVVADGTLDSEAARTFEVISDVVCSSDFHPFSFAQAVCLALANLSHPRIEVRRSAFSMLEAVHHRTSGLVPMSHFDPAIGSQAPPTYLHGHRQVSEFLAGEHPNQALDVLAQLANWLPQLTQTKPRISLLLLQTLEDWIVNIQLRENGQFTREGMSALYHLMSLTLHYASTHTEQILALWTKLVEAPNDDNGVATALFLLQQSHKVGTVEFIQCSSTIIACLCQTRLGPSIYAELCSIIEPARMLPTLDHKLKFPDAVDMELWSDLDTLFAGKPRVTLSSAQYAWLFLADVAFQRQWDFKSELPSILHSIFIHLDYHHSFVRAQARRMLFQLLRSWIPGYDELLNRNDHPSCSTLKAMAAELEEEGDSLFWRSDEAVLDVKNKMARLCETVLGFLDPLVPRLAERWGSLAVSWGTSCSIRGFAFRSLQIFRAILPRTCASDMALLLGRLSNTISSADENIQMFTSELIQTLSALVSSKDLESTFLPQLYWCCCAGLLTTVQREFVQVLQLLESILDRVDLDDVTDILLSHQPPKWTGPVSLQPALLKGLRSSVTFEGTFHLLQRFAKVEDDRLIDASGGRVRDLYTAALPRCLYAMATDGPSESLKEFAEDIARLAEKEERHSIRKIMISFSKGHFRTKDDFLRQSVSSLREHYSTQWHDIDTLLLGLVLNNERWTRIYSMQILKGLFQQRVARNPSDLLGSELLMPLLRLLETDLAPNSLEVLEEPIAMSGSGPPAKHVLRMSMHSAVPSRMSGTAAEVFGVPEESGWCVARADNQRSTCHHNMTTVFDTCSISARPSRIDFEPEHEVEGDHPHLNDQEDLGGLVQKLHELSTFFQDDEDSLQVPAAPIPPPDRRLEARVAAILAKSTATDAVSDVPQTPFLDVFRVSAIPDFDDSDGYSDSDSDDEPFIFDSPAAAFRTAPKGSPYH